MRWLRLARRPKILLVSMLKEVRQAFLRSSSRLVILIIVFEDFLISTSQEMFPEATGDISSERFDPAYFLLGENFLF